MEPFSADAAASSQQPGGAVWDTQDSDRRLQAIARARASSLASRSLYRLGPGDVLEVKVLELEEMNRTARVTQTGDIDLPLIGAVHAAGRTEREVAGEIARRLDEDFLGDARVDVFVNEYKSQRVSVTGAVAQPGFYSLTRDRYTILDMIAEAGGLGRDAGPIVEFIPSHDGALRPSASPASPAIAASGEAISIETSELFRGGNPAALNVPVVAGDVIFVPEAGSFTIEGWIDKPGSYPLSRTTTVLAALTIAGGSIFPARLQSVEILRTAPAGGRDTQVVDLAAIRDGRARDVSLHSGDIVQVPANPLLVPPWAVYSFFKAILTIGVGASVPVI